MAKELIYRVLVSFKVPADQPQVATEKLAKLAELGETVIKSASATKPGKE